MTKILIVDDNPILLNCIDKMLDIPEYEVNCKLSAKEALNEIDTFNPEIIITDILMPEMHGLELIEQLSKDHADIKVISMSGGNRFSSKYNILSMSEELGAIISIEKPFSQDKLFETITSVLKH